MADISNQFRLKWETHHDTLMSMLQSLLQREKHVDVTLAAEGQFINVHRLVLIASSPYFENLLGQQPDKAAIIFLKDVSFNHLQTLVQYIYQGEVTLAEEDIPAFIQTADSLKIKGLMKENKKKERKPPSASTTPKAAVIEEKENLGIITPKLEDFDDGNADLDENEQEMESNHSSLLLSDDEKVEPKVEPTAGPSRKSTNPKKRVFKIKLENKKNSEDPFKCVKCGRGYLQLKRLKQHLSNGCGNNFPCNLCTYKSKWMGNLRLHLVRKHKIDPSQLANHGAGPKQYQCKLCPFAGKRNDALLKHMRIFHD